MFCPHGPHAPNGAGPADGAPNDWRRALALAELCSVAQCRQKTCLQDKGTSLPPASQSTYTPGKVCICCALPTWWSWRGGCTRSHSEHGRETPQRRWYFVLRRGRVGRCQVCKTQHVSSHNYENWNKPRVAHRGPFLLFMPCALFAQGLSRGGAAPAGPDKPKA